MCDGYNSKTDIPQTLDVAPEEEIKIKEFKEKYIYNEIIDAEIGKGIFSEWVDFNANAKWEKKPKEESDAEGGMADD